MAATVQAVLMNTVTILVSANIILSLQQGSQQCPNCVLCGTYIWLSFFGFKPIHGFQIHDLFLSDAILRTFDHSKDRTANLNC